MMLETKRQVLPKGLWVVATPIGNLADLTLRARWALEEAELILCEDTRRTSQLLNALELSKGAGALQRLDAHTPSRFFREWIERMRNGISVALVTDAGTPAISDPGAEFVCVAREAGIQVTPIPGVSAVTALVSICGFHGETEFTFRGFFPRKDSERESEINLIEASPVSSVYIWFESPERIEATLYKVASCLSEAPLIACKELTKLYEKCFHGTARSVADQVSAEIRTQGAKGEWCFALHSQSNSRGKRADPFSLAWTAALECLLEAGVQPSDAAQRVSQKFGIPRNEVYRKSLGKK